MSLVLLVEGSQTEPQVYRAWLKAHNPELQPASTVADLTPRGYLLVRGDGFPSYARRISGILRDIKDNPGKVLEFWICVDSDEDSHAARYAKVQRAVTEGEIEAQLQRDKLQLTVRIIIQHCCIETWFLGHDGFMRTGPQSRALVDFKRFFDVSADDPEQMGTFPGYVTRQSFHEAYLKAMLAERGHSYTKQRPRVVLERSYFEALQKRCLQTGHIPSFRKLVDSLGELKQLIASRLGRGEESRR